MGYPERGLEVWGYPFQILSNYQVGFRPEGTLTEADGRLLLRRIDYRPESVTRTYIGPDYIVREKLFVPLDQAAAILTYEVEGRRPVEIHVHFLPVLNLMWPAATGAQYTEWRANVSGYVITEPEHGLSAVVGSPDIVAHDTTVNSTLRGDGQISFSLRPRAVAGSTATASVYIGLNADKSEDSAATLHDLVAHQHDMETEAAAHYTALEGQSLQIQTPDDKVNSALAWSEIALEQAWVCNPKLGCGIVAGYGPSRDQRRPQYDWFFAGDGMVATNALVSAGEYSRARDELAFITKYQDPATGMVWHELSQSAGYVDWSKYPYMFVHVDISFDYLIGVARYVSVSGDKAFAMDHWSSIDAAYKYCRSIVQNSDHLPHIPAGKEGGDEQARPADDLGLSASWVAAASGFSELAEVTGHAELSRDALQESQLARQAVAPYYWDSAKNFWIDGHTQSGTPIFSRRRGPMELLAENVFSPAKNEALLDQLASSDFQSDWGMRGVAAGSGDFDPFSYGRGSISALGTAGAARAFWKAHRPEIAFALWSAILPWNTLDSPGHIHEVLAGSYYHEQEESVPEQTWSSAGLIDSATRGLLGLDVQGVTNSIHLAPHLPAEWNQVAVENVRLPNATLGFTLHQSMSDVDLEIRNAGGATKILFEPQIPLGAHLLGSEFEDHTITANTEIFPEEEQAKLEIDAPSGTSHCHLRFEGGVSIIRKRPDPRLGDPSTEMKLIHLRLQDRTLSIEAETHKAGNATFRILTPWKIAAQKGATVRALPNGQYEVTIKQPSSPANVLGYSPALVEITFAGK